MNLALLLIICLLILSLAYIFYARIISKIIGINPARPTPAVESRDDIDFVPTKPVVLFAHHYATIAGAGPIIGPTLALIYGYMPVLLWIVFGVILIGAVHDFTSLFVAVRSRGSSIGEVARNIMGLPGFVLFISFALLLCILVGAAFIDIAAQALTSFVPSKDLQLPLEQQILKTSIIPPPEPKLQQLIEEIEDRETRWQIESDLRKFKAGEITEEHIISKAGLDRNYKMALYQTGLLHVRIGGIASTSAIVMTFLAPVIGILLYRIKIRIFWGIILAIGVCAISVITGLFFPVILHPDIWRGAIGVYSFISGWIAIWLLLQPRDFINAHLLYFGLIVMLCGIFLCGIGGIKIEAQAFNVSEGGQKVGLIWPMLFITVACGAVSGAHGLVTGGTTCKQIANEKHIRPIGYGAMLLEGVLAVTTVLVVAGIFCIGGSFDKYTMIVYPAEGKGNPALAFALAISSILNQAFGLQPVFGVILGFLLLEGFLLTTVDTLVRIARYLLQEIWGVCFKNPPGLLLNRGFNSLLVIGIILLLIYTNGYLIIWPAAGSANQLLAALILLTISLWLIVSKKGFLFTLLPACFMTVTTLAALFIHIISLTKKGLTLSSLPLFSIDIILIILAIGFVFISTKAIIKYLSTKR